MFAFGRQSSQTPADACNMASASSYCPSAHHVIIADIALAAVSVFLLIVRISVLAVAGLLLDVLLLLVLALIFSRPFWKAQPIGECP